MAQWIARLTSNQAVAGSNPAGCVRDARHGAITIPYIMLQDRYSVANNQPCTVI